MDDLLLITVALIGGLIFGACITMGSYNDDIRESKPMVIHSTIYKCKEVKTE